MIETLKHKQLGSIKGIFVVLGLVVCVLLLVFSISFIQFVFRIMWPQFIAYAIVIIAGVLIVKYYLMEYIYVIENGRIIFYRKLGSREKELLAVPLRDIAKCGEYAELKEGINGKKLFKYTYLKKETAYAIDFKLFVVLISVSDEFKQKLRGKK